MVSSLQFVLKFNFLLAKFASQTISVLWMQKYLPNVRTCVKRVMRGEPPRPDMGAVEKTASSLPNLNAGHGSMPETLICTKTQPESSIRAQLNLCTDFAEVL